MPLINIKAVQNLQFFTSQLGRCVKLRTYRILFNMKDSATRACHWMTALIYQNISTSIH